MNHIIRVRTIAAKPKITNNMSMDTVFVAALREEVVGLEYFHLLGVGKINAAFRTSEIIANLQPKEIVNFGTAGAVNKNLKGIIECTKFFQRDMDCRGLLDFKLGDTPFDDLNEIIFSTDGFSCGTGDNFVKKEIEMEVDVVDMEAYAIAKVCYINKIKFRCFKFISDNADQNANLNWIDNLKLGARKFEKFRKEKLIK